MSLTSNAVTVRVQALSAPSWFTGQADSTWLQIPGTSAGTLAAVAASPTPDIPSVSSEGGIDRVCTAWTGATVDQGRSEYLMIANGGHADYPGNEGYALDITKASCAWRRISSPTPNGSLDPLGSTNGVATYGDGRPRADHTSGSYQWTIGGKVFFMCHNSASSNPGGASTGVFVYDRELLGAATTPAPYATNPWSIMGQIPGMEGASANGSFTFGTSCYDSIDQWVYGWSGYGWDRTTCYYWRVKAAAGGTPAYGTMQSGVAGGGNPYANFNWACCATDLRICVLGDGANNRVIVFNIASGATSLPGSANFTIPATTGTGHFGKCTASYIAANKTIAIVNPQSNGKVIYRLQIPTSGGAYNPSGTWAWSTINPATGATPNTDAASQGVYGKAPLVQNVAGSGRAAILYCGGSSLPTYCYKIPAAGL